MTKAGIIGLGQIGGGVAICLARSGQLEAVYDIRADAAATLEGVPTPLPNPAAVAASCDVVLLAVVDAAQCRAVLFGPDGVLSQARPEMVVAILSTIALDELASIRAETEAAGVLLVDCGVTGGLKVAQNGLVCLVGATDAAFGAVKPVLDGFARRVFHMGGPGAGMAAKIARNVIVYNAWRAAYEGARVAEAAGVDVRLLAEAIDASADSTGGPAIWMKRDADPREDSAELALRQTAIRLMHKDLDAALALGRDHGIALPMAQLTHDSARHITGLEPEPRKPARPVTEDRFAKGLAVFEEVYGPGSSQTLVGGDRSDFSVETVTHLFGDIWSRSTLSVRDRRFMLIGVSAMLGRADLIEIQIRGAIANGELDRAQIDEIPLFLAFYVGWCNSGPLYRGILGAKRALDEADGA